MSRTEPTTARTARTRRGERPRSRSRRTLSAALGLGLAAVALAVGPAGAAQAAPSPHAAGVRVLTYNDDQAPSFHAEITASTVIWNTALTTVQLLDVEGPADFYYIEGDFPGGTTSDTDGHGQGQVFLDFAQSHQYDALRMITHETGHVFGLPDHYSGPCSELMSGGGPGASCTNARPNASEAAQVDALWANGVSTARHQRALASR